MEREISFKRGRKREIGQHTDFMYNNKLQKQQKLRERERHCGPNGGR